MNFKNGRRWNYFKDNLVGQFGELVYKVGVDAGFDCPNRDGSKAWGGCAYCSQQGSLATHQDPTLGIVEQIQKGRDFVSKRYGAQKFIVYFQAFTNTYAPVATLRQRYDAALIDNSIVGLSVATRPDCITEENADLLAEYAERLPIFTVELGLQSAFQNRLEWVNRQESVEDYVRAMRILNERKLKTITHVILGFPGESLSDMRQTVQLADECRTYGIKLQMLHVIRGTKLAHLYKKEPFVLMDFKEYGDTVVDLVERLDPAIEIHRITGETDREHLMAPLWVRDKTRFFDWFEAELLRRITFQGRLSWNGSLRSKAPLEAELTL